LQQNAVVQLDEEPEVIPPIPDPLGISSVDLRSIQSFYASGNELLSVEHNRWLQKISTLLGCGWCPS
jgi:hypothetical protein